jgi:S-adenosylmethionine synthetase
VGTVVLPQLESVKEVDTIKWLWGDCQNQITPSYDTLKDMEAKIIQFYEGHSNGIPMEILASQLQKILQESTT